MAPTRVYLPEMALTLVRRVTARLPYNHYLFRTDPKWTKLEIKEYLHKVYGVRVAAIATSISLGASRCGSPRGGACPARRRRKATARLPLRCRAPCLAQARSGA
jgi:ribosomal protein L23